MDGELVRVSTPEWFVAGCCWSLCVSAVHVLEHMCCVMWHLCCTVLSPSSWPTAPPPASDIATVTLLTTYVYKCGEVRVILIPHRTTMKDVGQLNICCERMWAWQVGRNVWPAPSLGIISDILSPDNAGWEHGTTQQQPLAGAGAEESSRS